MLICNHSPLQKRAPKTCPSRSDMANEVGTLIISNYIPTLVSLKVWGLVSLLHSQKYLQWRNHRICLDHGRCSEGCALMVTDLHPMYCLLGGWVEEYFHKGHEGAQIGDHWNKWSKKHGWVWRSWWDWKVILTTNAIGARNISYFGVQSWVEW